MTSSFCLLDQRGLIAITGEDTDTFLQGIVSNDVTKVTPAEARYAAFLTAQGKFLHDFFMSRIDDTLILDCESHRQADLMKRLKMYKLRSKAALADWRESHVVAALFGDDIAGILGLEETPGASKALGGGVVFIDPRLPEIGARAVLPKDSAESTLADLGLSVASAEDYELCRLSLGLPDGSRDMTVDKAILLENGFSELNGVDWDKGCFMGQELTARTKYRALIKKRLLPITIDGPLPEPGTSISNGEKPVGEVFSGLGNQALALIRLEAIDRGDSFSVDGNTVTVSIPDWVVIEKAEDPA